MDHTVEAFLAPYTPDVRDLALGARALILSVLPDATEHVYPGWKTIGYGCGAGMARQICYIAPGKAAVSLGFNQGTALPDPQGLLTGTGKLLRHVKLRQPVDLAVPALRTLLVAAVGGE